MAKMGLNIAGRIKNFNLGPQQTFLTVLEAVVNSIHSIIEREKIDSSFKKGSIEIHINREKTLVENEKDIVEITITDNGIGFTEANMKSFLTADSDYKAELGGKGIGRFSWLKAFSNIEVESVYKEYLDNGLTNRRIFNFSLKNMTNGELDIVDKLEDYSSQYNDNKTIVKLSFPKLEYKQGLRLTKENMTLKVIEHCIEYFLEHPEINIILVDDERISINDRITSGILQTHIDSFKVSDESFTIRHLFVSKDLLKQNCIYWSGNQRIVTKQPLDKYLVNTKGVTFLDNTANYIAVISGDFLDKSVGDNRTIFNLPLAGYDEGNLFPEVITLTDIYKAAKDYINNFLASEIKLIQDESEKRVKTYINKSAPEYNYLLKYQIEEIRTWGTNISDDKLDSRLHDLERKHHKKIVGDLKALKSNNALSLEDYKIKFTETVEKISESNKAKLVEYVSHRKVILDLFEDGLNQHDEQYKDEAYIHNLIYPMKGTRDLIQEPLHNLWLIDERLAFCEYIASDIALNKQGPRPDLLFLDNSVALSDEDASSTYNTISIVELKKPMRSGYNEKDNPMIQMINYVRDIKEGKANSKHGRPIKVNDNTQFYLYAVCDIDNTLKRVLQNGDYTLTADGAGYYKYHSNLKAHVEVIPFDKVLRNAKQRNLMFFKQLGV